MITISYCFLPLIEVNGGFLSSATILLKVLKKVHPRCIHMVKNDGEDFTNDA